MNDHEAHEDNDNAEDNFCDDDDNDNSGDDKDDVDDGDDVIQRMMMSWLWSLR